MTFVPVCNNSINGWLFLSFVIRYKFNGTQNFTISHPIRNNIIVGIQLFTLNIVRNIDELSLSAIKSALPRQNRIRHFVVCEQPITASIDSKLSTIFNEFWQKQVLNILIIYWNCSLSVVTYTPFPRLKLLFIPTREMKNRRYLFGDKAKNMMGYPLRSIVFYDESRLRFDKSNLNNVSALEGADGLLGRFVTSNMLNSINVKISSNTVFARLI